MNRLDYSLFTRLQLWFRLTNLMAIFVYHNEQTHDKVAVNMAFFYGTRLLNSNTLAGCCAREDLIMWSRSSFFKHLNRQQFFQAPHLGPAKR